MDAEAVSNQLRGDGCSTSLRADGWVFVGCDRGVDLEGHDIWAWKETVLVMFGLRVEGQGEDDGSDVPFHTERERRASAARIVIGCA
jgi:hypothetical protein